MVSVRSILFVCIGNSCRSQMAEGFARAYGADVLRPASAGISPASTISPLTRQVMLERNIPLDAHFPKGLELFGGQRFDILVDLSGTRLPKGLEAGEMLQWLVPDPIGGPEGFFRQVRDQIETLVMQLILRLRNQPPGNPQPGGEQPRMRVRFRGMAPVREN